MNRNYVTGSLGYGFLVMTDAPLTPTLMLQARTHSRAAVALAVAGAVACGLLIASQARVNSELSYRLGDGVLTALISFSSGLIIVSIALVAAPTARRGLVTAWSAFWQRRIPWWYAAGGAAGAFFVLSQGLVAGVLGVALFTVAVVTGQTLAGLVLDARGLGSMAATRVTATRIGGAVLALVAVGYAASSQINGDAPIWMLLLPFISGLGIGFQQAANGQVREVSASAIAATFVNFIVGTVVLLIAVLVHSTWAGWPSALPTNPVLYLAGLIAVTFIAGAAIIVRITGVLLLSLGTIAGQLVGSLVLDIVAPVAGHTLTLSTVIGTAITLVAVSIAALPRRRR
jgi:transporter family-2 protein